MDKKQIPALPPLDEAPADDDRFVVRDTSSGSDKSLRVDRMLERSADQVSEHSNEEGGIHGIPEGERALHTADIGTTKGTVAAGDDSRFLTGVNDIINGKFQIAQTGTEFVSPASGAYDLDGWVREGMGGAVTITRVAGSVTGSYARESNVTTAKTTLAAGDYEAMNTRILGYDCVKYINAAFVVALRVKSSLTGIHCINLFNGTSSFVHEFNILAADTWQDVVVPVPMGAPAITSSTNGIGLSVRIAQATGTTYQTATTDEWVTGNFLGTANQVNGLATVGNKLTIEDVRINLGTAPLPNVTGYDAELARCEYYQRLFDGTGGASVISSGVMLNTTAFSGFADIHMRASPVLSILSGTLELRTDSTATATSPVFTKRGSTLISSATASTALTTGAFAMLRINNGIAVLRAQL